MDNIGILDSNVFMAIKHNKNRGKADEETVHLLYNYRLVHLYGERVRLFL